MSSGRGNATLGWATHIYCEIKQIKCSDNGRITCTKEVNLLGTWMMDSDKERKKGARRREGEKLHFLVLIHPQRG